MNHTALESSLAAIRQWRTYKIRASVLLRPGTVAFRQYRFLSYLFIYYHYCTPPLSQLQQSQLCRARVTRRSYLRNNERGDAVLSFRAIPGAILHRKGLDRYSQQQAARYPLNYCFIFLLIIDELCYYFPQIDILQPFLSVSP